MATRAQIALLGKAEVLKAVKAYGTLSLPKLSVKLLVALQNVDARLRDDVRRWALKPANLRNIPGVRYDEWAQRVEPILDRDEAREENQRTLDRITKPLGIRIVLS